VAWRKFATPTCDLTARIELIQERPRKPTVYRMVGADPQGGDIIAKRCGTGTARTERIIYEEILPRIPISTIRYYGSAPDDDERFWWLFLEDAAGEPFSSECQEHRELAGRWLGLMHTCAERIPAAAAYLPDRTGAFYSKLLETASETTEDLLTRAALEPGCATLLAAVVSHCQQLAHDWSGVERLCDGIPLTLLHGDLGDQNARVRNGSAGKTLLVMDWEEAGWGIPAADLAQFGGSTLEPDLTSYWSVVRLSWTDITLEAVKRWADVGRLLRLIQAVVWTNSGFNLSPRREWYFDRMEWYEAKFGEWIHAAGKTVT
jgi:Ser/Thr protein kinase RdoA (MazF antagonist)